VQKCILPLIVISLGALLSAGCATKTYVKNSVDPVSNKLDQVAAKTDQQGQTIDQTRHSLDETKENLEKDETQLSAANERAISADNRAGQALDSAGQANQKADRLNSSLSDLKNVVSNLDDYKQIAETTVNFAFDSDRLTPDAQQMLDQLTINQGQYKRFFISVEGFTDHTGSSAYNDALSRRRADAVVKYLVEKHDIPVYRIQTVGLGKDKPLDEARTRAAHAKNRRVTVTLFSADQNVAQNRANSDQATGVQQ